MTVATREKRFVLTVGERIRQELQTLIGQTPVTLASGSPRRREILTLAGIQAEVLVPDINEDVVPNLAPQDFARYIATCKLESIPSRHGITVSADTIVVLEDQILGKPVDKPDARRMLKLLSNRRHIVITALAIRDEISGQMIVDSDKSYVTFCRLRDEDIDDYIESGEPMDKAGAYGIQGMGELLVDRLEGSLHNVIGFPIELFVRMMRELRA